MTEKCTLFELDYELDTLLEEIDEQIEANGYASPELLDLFETFCDAKTEKIDRIGRFLTLMQNRLAYCRQQSDHFQKRAHAADTKIARTQGMVLYFLQGRGLRKVEGKEYTLRLHKNGQDSVSITDPLQLPMEFKELHLRVPGRLWESVLTVVPKDLSEKLESCVKEEKPMKDAIKQAAQSLGQVPGTAITRGIHLRVA